MSEQFTRLNARFPHKRVFITGASSGLGLELAKQLASDGWTLGLFDRDLERLTRVEAQFAEAGVQLVAYPGDVTQADELTVAVNSFAATHDGLDVMINNAGVAGGGSMMEVSLEDWRWIIDINVMGVVHGSRAAIPHLQRNGSGLLINIASAAAFASAPGMISYNATKAAVVSISETLVNELQPVGTQVSVVMPAFFRSSLLETLRGPEHARVLANRATQRSELSVEQAARALLTESADGQTYIVLPKSARMMWRMKRWMPLRFLDRVRDFARRQPAG
ncbi:SDR family NAD(P)-dependent oxidoreductase [Steroidobacter cummioxidans]|uniref:SDR family NAD(P)-dependent oxidoreductase n=1 Tax=Steroidobacter cummioxidans TaxID=1803913 RepID=UPI000E3117AC|nr:SDR family NAD(P)-dependent oxidoreductase [Steroidobacter cummioxidans]